jgi:hypothetical protein
MCGWMLALLVIPEKTTTVSSTWHSDLSGLPYSKKRAYGTVLKVPFLCEDATVKRLKPITFLDAHGAVTESLDVFALTLSDRHSSATVYFTRKPGDSLDRLDYRHRPADAVKKNMTGITSIQFTAPDPKSELVTPHVYRDGFSARLSLSSRNDGRLTGSIIAVFPDSQRSFVIGSFKARIQD